MNETIHYTEAATITVARTIVFVLAVALVAMSSVAFDLSGALIAALAFILLGLVADALVVWLGGARGRMIARAVIPTVAVWLIALGLVALLSWGPAWTTPEQPRAFFGFLLLFFIGAVVAVVLLPRTQAIGMWVLASLGMASPVVSTVVPPEGLERYVIYIAGVLAAGSLGALGYYVRRALARRLGWRRLAARLTGAALAVACLVGTAIVGTSYVGGLGYYDQAQTSLAQRYLYGSAVARQLSATFDEDEFAVGTPALDRELIRYSALGGVGLTVYDRAARHVVAAVRLAPVSRAPTLGTPPSSSLGEPASLAFMVVSLGPAQKAGVIAASEASTPPQVAPAIGPMPDVPRPLGFLDRRAHPSVTLDATGTSPFLLASAPNPDGTRLVLVISEPTDEREGPAISPEQISRDLSMALVPWLSLAFMFVVALGLVALDRGDSSTPITLAE